MGVTFTKKGLPWRHVHTYDGAQMGYGPDGWDWTPSRCRITLNILLANLRISYQLKTDLGVSPLGRLSGSGTYCLYSSRSLGSPNKTHGPGHRVPTVSLGDWTDTC